MPPPPAVCQNVQLPPPAHSGRQLQLEPPPTASSSSLQPWPPTVDSGRHFQTPAPPPTSSSSSLQPSPATSSLCLHLKILANRNLHHGFHLKILMTATQISTYILCHHPHVVRDSCTYNLFQNLPAAFISTFRYQQKGATRTSTSIRFQLPAPPPQLQTLASKLFNLQEM